MIRNIIRKINFDTAYYCNIVGHTFVGTMVGIYIGHKETRHMTEQHFRIHRLCNVALTGVVGTYVGFLVGATSIILYPIATISYIYITIGDKINK
jgi:hypothetical protein